MFYVEQLCSMYLHFESVMKTVGIYGFNAFAHKTVSQRGFCIMNKRAGIPYITMTHRLDSAKALQLVCLFHPTLCMTHQEPVFCLNFGLSPHMPLVFTVTQYNTASLLLLLEALGLPLFS